MAQSSLEHEAAQQVILAGFSDASVVAAQLHVLDDELALERAWYHGVTPYESLDDITVAESNGRLIKVYPDTNVRPITRFMNPELHGKYLPLLSSHAASVLSQFGEAWREEATEDGVADGVRLAVTSLTRTLVYQRQLVQAGKFASDRQGTHTVGNAFDIDLGGYYVGQQEHELTAVSVRSVASQEAIARAFTEGIGATDKAPQRLGAGHYDARVERATLRACSVLEAQGVIKGLVEMAGTTNRCLHVAVAPKGR